MPDFQILCWDGYDEGDYLHQFEQSEQVAINASVLVSDTWAAQQVLGDHANVDILNINNPYARKQLFPSNKILSLDKDKFSPLLNSNLPWASRLCEWGYADSGELIGIPQRFGPFNFVVNNHRISASTAADEGFNLISDSDSRFDYGILLFPEFNVFHICISAGLNPFGSLSEDDLCRFDSMATHWFRNASLITSDSNQLNRALVDGEIDLFMSGGLFTSAHLRLQGHLNIEAITPKSGPIDGHGAIAFMEITSIPTRSSQAQLAENFLAYILDPTVATQIASNEKVCNPIVQMGNPEVFSKMSSQFLKAIQWDSLQEDVEHCANYDIPVDFPALLTRLENIRQQVANHEK